MCDELQDLQNNKMKWYTNVPLTELKEIIKDNINIAARSFITIGYYLKNIRDRELFKENGYSGILEFAQAEFGISKSWASKWMSINDEFSVDGNSPILLEQYKGFSSGKLSEMLYLTEEQREQITISMTTAEIREIKNPVKENIEVNTFSSTKTEDNKSKCFIKSQIDNSGESDLKCSGGISDECYSCNKSEPNPSGKCIHRTEFDCTLPEASKLATLNGEKCNKSCCWNCSKHGKCGYECNSSSHRPDKEVQNDLSESVKDITETVDVKPETVNEVDKIVIETSKSVIEEPENVTQTIETVTADIIQTEPEHSPLWKQKQVIKDSIKQEEDMLNQMRESWKAKQPDTLIKHETLLMAYKSFLIELEYPNPESVKQTQSELPLFKNNDQRKEFIETYTTWPIWIDTVKTGERYYKYDFNNNTGFVIRVSLHHAWEHGKYSKVATYGCEEYFILGAPDKYKPGDKTFHECSTNKSAMIDYLKEIQKR